MLLIQLLRASPLGLHLPAGVISRVILWFCAFASRASPSSPAEHAVLFPGLSSCLSVCLSGAHSLTFPVRCHFMESPCLLLIHPPSAWCTCFRGRAPQREAAWCISTSQTGWVSVSLPPSPVPIISSGHIFEKIIIITQ